MFSEALEDIPYELEMLDDHKILLCISPRMDDTEKKILFQFSRIIDINHIDIWGSFNAYPLNSISIIQVRAKDNVILKDGVTFKAWGNLEFFNESPDKKYVIASDRRFTETVPWKIFWLYKTNGERVKMLPNVGIRNVPIWDKDSDMLYYMGRNGILSYNIETGQEMSVYKLDGEKHAPIFTYDETSGRIALVVTSEYNYGEAEYDADLYLFSSIHDNSPRIIDKALKIFVYDNVYFGEIKFIDQNTIETKDSDGKIQLVKW